MRKKGLKERAETLPVTDEWGQHEHMDINTLFPKKRDGQRRMRRVSTATMYRQFPKGHLEGKSRAAIHTFPSEQH